MPPSSLKRSFQINVLFKYGNIALSLVSAVLLVPYYLAHLSASEYGAWLSLGAFATLFAAMDPGIANLLIQRVARSLGEHDTEELLGYVTAGLTISAVIAGFVAVAGYGSAPWIVRWLGAQGLGEDLLVRVLRLSILSTAVMILVYAAIAVFQGLHDSLAAGLSLLLTSIARMVLSVALLAAGFGLVALPIAALVAACLALGLVAMALVIRLRRLSVRLGLRMRRLGEFSSLFVYSFGARLGKLVTGNLDSVLIGRFLGVDHVATYALTATAPRQSENLINLPVAALRAPLAHLAGRHEEERLALARTIRGTLQWMIWTSGFIAAGLLGLNEDFVRLWVGGDYFAGANVSLALALLFALRTFTNSVGAIGFSLGDIKRNSVAEWAYSLILVPAVLVGLELGDLLGVVLGHIAAQALTMGWYFPRSVWRSVGWGGAESRHFLKELIASVAAASAAFVSCVRVETWLGFAGSLLAVSSVYVIVLACVSQTFRHHVRAWKRLVAPQ